MGVGRGGMLVQRHEQCCALQASLRLGGKGSARKGGVSLGVGKGGGGAKDEGARKPHLLAGWPLGHPLLLGKGAAPEDMVSDLHGPDVCTNRLRGLPPAGTARPSTPRPPMPARSRDTMHQETPPGRFPLVVPIPPVEPSHLLDPMGNRFMAGARGHPC